MLNCFDLGWFLRTQSEHKVPCDAQAMPSAPCWIERDGQVMPATIGAGQIRPRHSAACWATYSRSALLMRVW